MKTTTNITSIQANKNKLIFILLFMFALIAVGFWFALAAPYMAKYGSAYPVIIGVSTIIVCSIFSILLFIRLIDKKSGLFFEADGFIDNSNLVSAGKVLWTDIVAIEGIEMNRQKLILVRVKNPSAYLDKQKGAIKKYLLKMNMQMYGTPIFLSNVALKISFDELLALLMEKMEEGNRKL